MKATIRRTGASTTLAIAVITLFVLGTTLTARADEPRACSNAA
jgi:hypothetical protein